ncbi:hypothetical protein OL548_18000 [Lysinibacillus sp. MHQ-1]|nr:hypothetical protein OL548_18000 [Lysinibacillus sp. MHQ-1]
MIRVLLAEDQQMLRGALTSLLSFEPDIEVIAEVSDGQKSMGLHSAGITRCLPGRY